MTLDAPLDAARASLSAAASRAGPAFGPSFAAARVALDAAADAWRREALAGGLPLTAPEARGVEAERAALAGDALAALSALAARVAGDPAYPSPAHPVRAALTLAASAPPSARKCLDAAASLRALPGNATARAAAGMLATLAESLPGALPRGPHAPPRPHATREALAAALAAAAELAALFPAP